MAGRGAIQFLRGTSAQRKASSESLLPGQPFYETDTNKLYVGGVNGTDLNDTLITPISSSIRAFWENAGSGGAVRVRVGDRAFIETGGGHILPALCVDLSQGCIWQVSWFEKYKIADSSATEWGRTLLWGILNGVVVNQFPDYLKNKIESRTVSSGGDDKGTSCKLWPLSAEEIWGENNAFSSWVARDSKSRQFEYYNQLLGDNTRPSVSNTKLRGNNYFWLRNRDVKTDSYWSCVSPNGFLSNYEVSSEDGVVFCFSLS